MELRWIFLFLLVLGMIGAGIVQFIRNRQQKAKSGNLLDDGTETSDSGLQAR